MVAVDRGHRCRAAARRHRAGRVVNDPGDGSEVLARSQELLEAVEARDGDAITAMLDDDHELMAPNESHARQPQATDLLVGDAAAAEAIDLELSWTPPELDRTAETEPLTNVHRGGGHDGHLRVHASPASGPRRPTGSGSPGSATASAATWGLHHVVTPGSRHLRVRLRARAVRGHRAGPRGGRVRRRRLRPELGLDHAGVRRLRQARVLRSASRTAGCPTPSTRASATSWPCPPPSGRSSSRCCRPS